MPATHLLIPFAAASSEASREQLRGLALPNLSQLLHQLILIDTDAGSEDTFSPPHERAWAKALGLSVMDGCIPWAAKAAVESGLDTQTNGTAAWGWLSLCNYFVGNNSMTLENPAQLHITEDESRALLADMLPYFAEDGIALHYGEPSRWLACGEPLQNIPTASLDRVIGRNLDAWQPEGAPAARLRRLQNEMQMLLYTHPVNDARSRVPSASRLQPINSIWLHGTGELPSLNQAESVNITVLRSLAEAALNEDWVAWAQAWQQLDATVCADLLNQLETTGAATLTLCGERSAHTYAMRRQTLLERTKSKVTAIFGLQPASNKLGLL